MDVTVDVMLPFYGDVGHLKEAVTSVMQQDVPDWRLTVVDDAHPDPAVQRWFGDLDCPRIRYERNTQNLGANGNYRKCLSLVEHDLVVIMGADDIMLPHYIRTVQKAFAGHPNCSIVQPGVRVIDENGHPIDPIVDRVKRFLAPPSSRPTVLVGEVLATSLLHGDWLYFPSLCWKREALQETGFREGLNVVQDLALVLDLTASGHSLVADPTTCFEYRRHRKSDSSWRAVDGTRFVEEADLFAREASRFDRMGWRRASRAARFHWTSRANALLTLPSAIRQRNREGARTLLRHILLS